MGKHVDSLSRNKLYMCMNTATIHCEMRIDWTAFFVLFYKQFNLHIATSIRNRCSSFVLFFVYFYFLISSKKSPWIALNRSKWIGIALFRYDSCVVLPSLENKWNTSSSSFFSVNDFVYLFICVFFSPHSIISLFVLFMKCKKCIKRTVKWNVCVKRYDWLPRRNAAVKTKKCVRNAIRILFLFWQ